MSNKKDIKDLIDAYLSGELRGKELVDFENELSENPVLKIEITKAKAIQNLVIQHKLLDIKSLSNQEEIKLKSRNKTLSRNIIIGLLAISLISGGVFFFQKTEEKQTNLNVTQLKNEEKKPIQNSKFLEKPNTEAHSSQKEVTITEKKAPKNQAISKVDTTTPNPIEIDTLKKDTITNSETETTIEIKPKEIQKEKSIEKLKQIDPCDTTNIELNLNTSPTCKGKQEGSIQIISIVGGVAPYQKALIAASGNEVTLFSDLASGNYTINITDDNSCKTSIKAIIQEKSCPINDHFNPSIGEVWKIPTANKNGKITIYTRNGVSVYEQVLISGENHTWNGYGNTGILEPGYYIFVIEYHDGNRIKGSLTITE